MFVCLCVGVTSQVVAEAVASGATTCNEVAKTCGAGADCGRCRRSIRAIIESRRPDR
jgi:bacterioferritin-associated ferredoxin